MLSLLTKPLSAITRGDIEALIDVAESQYLDFKEAPSPKGGAQRAEVSVTKKMWLTDAAKKELAKDVIAFANADGGILVLGIKETPDAPKRAREITQIPGCHELAERLERSLGDRIEPPVIGLQARGVEIEDGGGVVVIRVPASTTGPHAIRLDERPGLAVYVRRNDNARAATMRDIHDMVIDTAQSWQRAERILEERSKAALNRFSGSAEANTGYRITALPARARYEVRDLYMRERGNPDITWGNSMLMHIIVDGQNTLIKSHSEVRDFTYRPTLRGVSGGNGLDPDRHTITVSE